RHVGIAIQSVKHGICVGVTHAVGDGGEVGGSQRRVVFADDFHTIGFGVVLDDGICSPWENIIGTDKEKAVQAVFAQVIKSRDDLLVGGGAGVENIRRGLHALVLHRVEQQGVIALKDGEHCFAGGGGPSTKHGCNAFLLDEALG